MKMENVTYRELHNFCFWSNIYGGESKGDEIGGTCSTREDPIIRYGI
jgi:hypothetical protein